MRTLIPLFLLALGACRTEHTPAPRDTIVPLAEPGAPARDFPAPSRPVADVVTDTWKIGDLTLYY